MELVWLWWQEQRCMEVTSCGSGSGVRGSPGPESRAALQGGSQRGPRLACPGLVCLFGAFLFLGLSQRVICSVKDVLCEIRAPCPGEFGNYQGKETK